MFTDHQCPVCERELATKGIHAYRPTEETGTVRLRLTTEPAMEATCKHGHRSIVFFNDPAHALLFERALYRLVQGQTRDAVLDAYTAFEMYISHVPSRMRYDREPGASPAAIRDQLAAVLKISDRALAAAMTCASLLSAGEPPSIPNRLANLRNMTVHLGHVATDAEADELCIGAAETIAAFETVLTKVASVNPTPYWLEYQREQPAKWSKTLPDEAMPITFVQLGTTLARANASGSDVRDRIAKYRQRLAHGLDGNWIVW